MLFRRKIVVSKDSDVTTRTTDRTIVVHCEPAADADAVSEERTAEPIVEADDREEAGYGYGV